MIVGDLRSILSNLIRFFGIKTMLLDGRKAAVEESMEDAYLDVSNYGIMATIVSRGKWGK